MEKYSWNDKSYDIEKLFKQLPVVKDHRTPEEIYQAIAPKVKTKKNHSWFFPTVAFLGTVSVAFLIVASLFHFSSGSIEEKSSVENVKRDVAMKALSAPEVPNVFSETDQRYVVQKDQNFITLGLPASKGENIVVPISIIIDKKEKTSIQEFKENLDNIPSESWGLQPADFENINKLSTAKSEKNGKKVIIDLQDNRSLSSSSRGGAFIETVKESLRYQNVDEVEFQTEGKPGAIIENNKQTILPIESNGKKAYFEYMYDQDYPVFLAPSSKKYKTLPEAITNMESEHFSSNPPLHAPIPRGVDIQKVKTEEDTKHVTVQFSKDSELMNNRTFIRMIDSLLLTARDFGYKTVTFTGAEEANISQIGKIQFNTKIPVPVAPNPVVIK